MAPLAKFCLRRWGGNLESFGAFQTMRFKTKTGFRLDFVRARSEVYRAPAALPSVKPGTLEEDLARRDFSINAMAVRLDEGGGDLLDPHGGRKDLERGVIRVLHPASFRDDPTRLFRAARYGRRYGFKPDASTEKLRLDAMKGRFAELLSRERLRNELLRVLEEEDPAPVLAQLKKWGLARLFHPDFSWPEGVAAMEGAPGRLGLVALHMQSLSLKSGTEDDGSDFVRSLNLERLLTQELLEALDVEKRKASPRSPLAALSRRLLESVHPDLPAAALEPLLVSGKDLKSLGLDAGPEFRSLLDHAARAQWRGEFSTRSQALRWLRSWVTASK